MSRGKKNHPPKKKHVNKPRPAAVVPLSDSEHSIKAQAEFEKAMMRLIEAERLADWGNAPDACIHSAYYAMHHCASAAILAAGAWMSQRAMSTLSSTTENWLPQSRVTSANLAECLAEHVRTEWPPTMIWSGARAIGNAAATTAEARAFINACMSKWSFSDNVTDDLD